jgi:hypothetical protein
VSLGTFHGIEYSWVASVKNSPMDAKGVQQDRLRLETVVDGRMYAFELHATRNLREESRPALYSVARGVKFPLMQNKPSGGSVEEDDEDADADKTDEEKSKDEDSEDKSDDKSEDEE